MDWGERFLKPAKTIKIVADPAANSATKAITKSNYFVVVYWKQAMYY